jgi:Flp pilus assembly protein protease CpaA
VRQVQPQPAASLFLCFSSNNFGGLIMWHAFIIAFVVTMAVGDLLWRRIPRQFTAAAFAVGLLFHALNGGFISSVLASMIATIIAVAFFRVGAIGGGDVKLIICLGAILGISDWLFAMNIAVFCAAFIALIQIASRKLFKQTATNIVELFRGFAAQGFRAHERINVRNPLVVRAPFGLAAAVGTIVAVVR